MFCGYDQTRRVEDRLNVTTGSLLTAQIGHVGEDPMGGNKKEARTPPGDKSSRRTQREQGNGA